MDFIGDEQASVWQPEQDKVNIALYGKALEELNECGSIIARCLIQGLEESEPEGKYLNREKLEEEIADVYTTLGHLQDSLHLNTQRIERRAENKYIFLSKWFRKLREGRDGTKT